MAFLTLNAFIDGLEALVIAGVVRSYIHGPPSAAPGTADCPAMFVHQPEVVGQRLAFGQQGGAGSMRAQLIILVEPVAQSRNPENFDGAVDMVDALESTLIDASCSVGGILGWTIRVTEFDVAGVAHWAVIADVEGGRWS